MDLIETNSNYIVTYGNKSLYFDRLTGKVSIKEAATVLTEWNPVCLGRVEGIIGKLRYDPDSCWRLFLIRSSEHVGYLPDGMEIRKITQVVAISLTTQPVGELNLSTCNRTHSGVEKRGSTSSAQSSVQKPLIGQMRLTLRNAAGTVDPMMSNERQRDKYERRIHAELSRLLQMEEEAFFYFSPGGGDVTSWTQRRYASSYWTGLSSAEDSTDSDAPDSNWTRSAHPAWRQPVWRRADTRFFWNTHMISEAVADADRLLAAQGFPAYGDPAPADVQAGVFEQEISDLEGLLMPIVQGYVEMEKLSLVSSSSITRRTTNPGPIFNKSSFAPTETQSDPHSVTVYYSATHRTNVEEPGSVVFHGLNRLTPVHEQMSSPNPSLSEYPESHDFAVSSRLDDVSELTLLQSTMTESADIQETPDRTGFSNAVQPPSSNGTSKRPKKRDQETGDVTVVLFSRRSRFRAGTRYRRRGIDEDGHVANYVETEQILQTYSGSSSQTVAFLQARGSVPLYWSQTGLKYRPPINLEKNDTENQAAFDRHWNELLTAFKRVVIVTLLDSGRKRAENVLAEAYLRHLLLYNNPRLTCVVFDFHDYCRNLRFENASVLLAGIMHLLQEMKFCWVSEQGRLCKQRWIFRVNCLDCLDRTNVVQCLFAEIVMATQLKKFGILGPDDHLPVSFMRTMQRMWANHGDAISQQYAGTIAMKGDYIRTGERTMNGMMRDGVSSMSRYYLRFRELARQAAIDVLLGNHESPELLLFRSGAGLKSESLQAKEENIRALIHRCRDVLLKPEETGLSECLLLAYSELNFDPQFVNTILIVTDQYLHFVRTDVPPRSRRPVYVRIPVKAVEKLELGLEPSVFRSRHPVLRIFYTQPSSEESQPISPGEPSSIQSTDHADKLLSAPLHPQMKQFARSNPELFNVYSLPIRMQQRVASDVEQAESEHRVPTFCNPIDIPADDNTPSHPSNTKSATISTQHNKESRRPIRFPRPVSSVAQHFLTFMQPNVRLFNTVLVPVPPGDETVQALQVVAAMILVAIRSTNRELDLLQYPSKVKLERLRQAPVPQAYLPAVDTQQLLGDLNGWQRDDASPQNKRSNLIKDKGADFDDAGLSSDGADPTDTRPRSGSTMPEMSSRVDKLRLRLNQIKLPDIRLRINRRQAQPPTTIPVAPDEAASMSSSTEKCPSQTIQKSEPNRLFFGLARFTKKVPAAATGVESKRSVAEGEQQPLEQDKPHSDASISSDDNPDSLKNFGRVVNPGVTDISNPTKHSENSGPSDWSQSENDMQVEDEEESENEPEYERGYADDEDEEVGGNDATALTATAEEISLAVPHGNRLLSVHKRSYSDAHMINGLREQNDRHLTDSNLIESSKQGDTHGSIAEGMRTPANEPMRNVTSSPQSPKLSQTSHRIKRVSLPKMILDKRHRLMYERISSITGKAWQSGVLGFRDWQSELSLTATSSRDNECKQRYPDLTRSTSVRPDIGPALATSTVGVNTAQLPSNGTAPHEVCGSQYSLVRSENMPEIALENPRQMERLRKKQLATLTRLDELRNEACPTQPVLSSFIIF